MRTRVFAVFFSLILSGISYGQKPGLAKAPSWTSHGSTDYSHTDARLIDDAKDGFMNLVHEVQVNLGARTTYQRTVIRILTAAGVQNSSLVSATYDPSYQRLFFHKISIFRNGKEIDKLDLSKIKTVHQEKELERYVYNGTVKAILFLEDVRKGDVIEYAYSVQGFNPIFNDKFSDEEEVQSGAPIGQILYRVICPRGRDLAVRSFRTNVSPVVTTEGPNKVYQWTFNNVAALREQENLPSWYNPYALVEVSEFRDWAEVNKWASALFPRPHAISAGLKEKIAEIKAVARGDREKEVLEALRFVQDEVRYMGVEMGVNSYKPNDPGKIFAQRFGDCKDKSFLLCTMLWAMGIDASPVLINTDDKQELHRMLPSAVDFDHCTVQVRLGNKVYWFDPTISFQRGGIGDIAFPDYKCGLVLTGGFTGLTDIPLQDRGRVAVREKFVLKDENGPAKMEFSADYTGSFADDMRYELNNNSLSDIQNNILDFYDKYYQGIRVMDSLKVEDDEATGKVTLHGHYTVDKIWEQKDGNRKAYFEPLWINNVLQKPQEHQRTMPFALDYPARYTEEMEIQTPDDWEFEHRPQKVVTPYFSFADSAEHTSRTLHLVYAYEALQDNVPADGTHSFLENYDKVKDDLGYELTSEHASGSGGGNGFELGNGMKAWICLLLLGVIFYFVRRR
jgi:transglutaminase-like putative cysteine protease